MFADNTTFPNFVPDQILTSDDLNALFGYLDEQGRMTRTNLLGIGIVCGLEVKTASDFSSITITRGTGITSEGYLVSFPETKYTEYTAFDPKKPVYYSKFVDPITHDKKFNTWELHQPAVVEDAKPLSAAFLAEKVVMLFVELLEIGNKNCDPNSCDDKGIHVEVTIRPLLVDRQDVLKNNLKGISWKSGKEGFGKLPEMHLPRFDVINTSPATTSDILECYLNLFKIEFFTAVETRLSDSYEVFSQLVSADFPSDPFYGLANSFSFLYEGNTTPNQLLHVQYYYDFFSDLVQAYLEFREKGMEVLALCTPDSSFFPRHLLLDEASFKEGKGNKTEYRHYFIPSPLFEKKDLHDELRRLFRRIVLMIKYFFIPPVESGSPNVVNDPFIRITPSRLFAAMLSEKAIPYYYHVNKGANPLYEFWAFKRFLQGTQAQLLSYRSTDYNTADDFVKNPLRYDLDQYDFLRIEGHIGKEYITALSNIKTIIRHNRLPVDVIALHTDTFEITHRLGMFSYMNPGTLEKINKGEFMNILCHFQDLESAYFSTKNELLCLLCKELKYYYDFMLFPGTESITELLKDVIGRSKVTLFKACASKGYMIRQGTMGQFVEKLFRVRGADTPVTAGELIDIFDLESYIRQNTELQGFITLLTAFFNIPLALIRLAKTLTNHLSDFDAKEYCSQHNMLSAHAAEFKLAIQRFLGGQAQETRTEGTESTVYSKRYYLFSNPRINVGNEAAGANATTTGTTTNPLMQVLISIMFEDLFDHLDVLVYSCKCTLMDSLKREYLKRVASVTELRQFSFFTRMHPGIQHKAGVPMGGTFIIVYHKDSGSDKKSKIQEGIVFADFYLPYLCFSECPPIHYIVPELKEPELKVSLSLQPNTDGKNEYCSGNDFIYSFTVSPEGGDIQPRDGVTLDANGKWQFNPLQVNMGTDDSKTLSFTYTKSGVTSSPVLATVYQKPEASFEIIQEDLTGLTIQFDRSSSRFGTAYTWDFGDGKTSSDSNPLVFHTYGQPGSYSVILTVTNTRAECTDTFTSELSIQFPVPTLSLEPNSETGKNDYSSGDTGQYEFKLDPAGGILTGSPNETGIIQTGGKYFFKPSLLAQKLGNKDSIQETFVYEKNGISSIPLTINVYHSPVSDFLVNPDSDISLTFTTDNRSAFSDKYVWLVNNQNAGTKKDLVEFDAGEGTHTIVLTATRKETKAFDASSKSVSLPVCGSVRGIINLLGGLENIDKENFGAFLKVFQGYDAQVRPFFEKLSQYEGKSVDELLKFFENPEMPEFPETNTHDFLKAWFTDLFRLISTNEQVRLISAELVRILINLTMFIGCVQDNDLVENPQVRVTDLIELCISRIKAIVKKEIALDKSIIAEIIEDINLKLKAAEIKGETGLKAIYLDLLKKFRELLSGLL